MAKFRIKAGAHREGGKVYNSGDVVESDNDLVKLFPEKFDRLPSSGTPTPSAKQPEGDTTQLVGTNIKDTPQTAKSGEPVLATSTPSPKPAKTKKAGKWDEDE